MSDCWYVSACMTSYFCPPITFNSLFYYFWPFGGWFRNGCQGTRAICIEISCFISYFLDFIIASHVFQIIFKKSIQKLRKSTKMHWKWKSLMDLNVRDVPWSFWLLSTLRKWRREYTYGQRDNNVTRRAT